MYCSGVECPPCPLPKAWNHIYSKFTSSSKLVKSSFEVSLWILQPLRLAVCSAAGTTRHLVIFWIEETAKRLRSQILSCHLMVIISWKRPCTLVVVSQIWISPCNVVFYALSQQLYGPFLIDLIVLKWPLGIIAPMGAVRGTWTSSCLYEVRILISNKFVGLFPRFATYKMGFLGAFRQAN